MPITWPRELISGPPESPGLMRALLWISLVSCSRPPDSSSNAVIDLSSALTVPLI
jgi:hypothetical protein